MNSSLLTKHAGAVLRRNDAGDFTKPSLQQYPHQWNWDSALAALGWSHFDLPRARVEVQALLRAQWRDGMVPHIVYRDSQTNYFPPPDFWQTEKQTQASTLASSGLTQPPILTTVTRALHERTQNDSAVAVAFLRSIYPQLYAWHRWLHIARDADGTGLPCLIHPWESGADNSPRWDAALDRIVPTDLPEFRRRDTLHVSPDERPLDLDYERFVYLIDLGRRARWDSQWFIERSPFLVQDVLFCAILPRADEDLSALAMMLGEDTREIDQWIERTRASFDAHFWDAERGLYFDYDVRVHAPIRVNTCATFAPLFAGLASREQATRLVTEHFDNPAEYAPNAHSRYRLPTTSKLERTYSPRRYWRGPIWIIINWIVWEGLKRYGFAEHAEQLRRDSLALIHAQDFREYYDPRDGAGCGAHDFSWSAALAIEMLKNASTHFEPGLENG